MPVYDIYSRRKKRAEQAEPDVYQYEKIPVPLRAQIQHIWDDAIGPFYEASSYSSHTPACNNAAWQFIRDSVCREKGQVSLRGERNPWKDCIAYLHYEENIDAWLDLVDFGFRYIDRSLGKKNKFDLNRLGIKQAPDDAIKELNFRFLESGVGYQFEGSRIIRIDSEYTHSEVVKPALVLLSDPEFAGAQEEFLAAHEHYRNREYRDCVVDSLNAFESTLKIVCNLKDWEHPKGARASDLIKVVRKNGLLPNYLDNSFDQLIATLASGLPKVRNEEGGHGQGDQPKDTPGYVAAYALHLAAADILLLVEAYKASI